MNKENLFVISQHLIDHLLHTRYLTSLFLSGQLDIPLRLQSTKLGPHSCPCLSPGHSHVTRRKTFNLPKRRLSPLPPGHSSLYMTSSRQETSGTLKIGKVCYKRMSHSVISVQEPLGIIHSPKEKTSYLLLTQGPKGQWHEMLPKVGRREILVGMAYLKGHRSQLRQRKVNVPRQRGQRWKGSLEAQVETTGTQPLPCLLRSELMQIK